MTEEIHNITSIGGQDSFEVEIDIEEIKAKLDALKNAESEHDKAIRVKKEQVAELQRLFQATTRERMELESEQTRLRQEARELEKTLSSAMRLQLVKEEQKKLIEQFTVASAELEELTKNATWRPNEDGIGAFPHQIEGGKRLALAKRGICADKRGLGKTLTSLIWLDMVRAKRVLVIAPNDVVSQFEGEIREWAPTRSVFPLSGLPKSQRDLIYPMLNMVDEFIITLNYEAWRKDKTIIDDLVKAGIDSVILDEAHRIKSAEKITARGTFQVVYRPNYCPDCKVTKNFMGPWQDKQTLKLVDKIAGFRGYTSARTYHELPTCPDCSGVLESTVQNVLCMTGTPILNKPQELFALLFLCNREAFPTESKFLDDYCYNAGGGKWRFQTGGLSRLTKFMSQFFIQRTRDDAGIHVPPPSITIHELEKDKIKYMKQYNAEEEISKKAQILLEDGTRKDIFFILEIILRERQCMTWPAGIVIVIKDPETGEVIFNMKFDVEESQKLDAATELLTELMEEEERVIVFSQFKAPLYEMHERMQKAGYSSCMATGDQMDYHKEQVKKDFDLKTAGKGKVGEQDGPKWSVCFATYKAFGTGINLNAARHMIILDDEWNAGMEDQAIGRIDRMNSTDQANVHIFRVKNSIDDFMAALIEEKRGITEGFNENITINDLMKHWTDKV